MKVLKYSHQNKMQWNFFLAQARNGNFLFNRNYMEYHSDRFIDYSLMFFDEKNRLIAVMPASEKDSIVNSHGGLTYGGIISDNEMKTVTMLKIFEILIDFLRKNGVKQLIYKPVPHFFHRMPAEEDLYALFVNGAALYRRDVSSAIYLSEKTKFAKGKREGIKKARLKNLTVGESLDFKTFFEIGSKVMNDRHFLKPVHSSGEMEILSNRFPENIKLYASYLENEMLAGVIAYIFPSAVHTQYMYNSDKGLGLGALDIVLDNLINEIFSTYRYFSFGISTEKDGTCLNEGLIHQKELFGAHSVVHDAYQINLT